MHISGKNLFLGLIYYTLNSGIHYFIFIKKGLNLFMVYLLNIVTNDFNNHDIQNK